jgi:hypothetical protein
VACIALIFRLAPTLIICFPSVSVPELAGKLVKLSTVIVSLAPSVFVNITGETGKLIEKEDEPSPVIRNSAAEMFPTELGRFTPPSANRCPVAVRIIMPAAFPAATFPKLRSPAAVFSILIGTTMVATTLADATFCALDTLMVAHNRQLKMERLRDVFIFRICSKVKQNHENIGNSENY